MIQQLGEPSGVPQKEPAHHCLKSRGLPIGGRIATPGSSPGPVPAPPHPVPLQIVEQRIQPQQCGGLGSGPDFLHNSPVQAVAAAGLTALTQPLMEFPDRIPQPGQLEWAQVIAPQGLALMQPDGRGWI